MKEILNDINYIREFFAKKINFVYLALVAVILSYLFATLQNMSNVIFTAKLLGINSVFNYLSFTLSSVIFHSSFFSSIVFIFTIIFLSIYFLIFINRFKDSHSIKGSGLGIISGAITFFGLGCISCGGLVLASLLGVIGVTGLVALLPFNGFEIQLLALIVSAISLFIFVRKSRMRVCEV